MAKMLIVHQLVRKLVTDKELMFRYVAQHGPIFFAVLFSLSSLNIGMDLHVPLLLLSETVGSGSS